MKFKKIYVEITNSCNLQCPFCIKNKREIKFITENNFQILINKIKNYTDYIYLHVIGEPLLHPNLNKLIMIAQNQNIKVNITTNGYLINNLHTEVRQVNISLHSFNNNNHLSLEKYMNNIFNSIKKFKKTKFSLRLWTKNDALKEIVKYINLHFNMNLDSQNLTNTKLSNNVYLNIDDEFIWPDLNNNYYNEKGKCYGLIDHIGILVDGTVVPCCLDSLGVINLGNIYQKSLEEILSKKRVTQMIEGFKHNKKCEELCKHCKFL